MMLSRAAARARMMAAGGVVLLALLAGCTSVAGSPVAGSVDHDLGQGLTWAGPSDATVRPFESSTGGCASASGSVTAGDEPVSLTLLAAGCTPTDQPPINGNHGQYLQPPSFAANVDHPGTVPTGALATFTQLYSEYTNSRTDFTDAVGLVTLADGGRYAVLMLTRTGDPDEDAAAALDSVTAVACAIRPTGGDSTGASSLGGSWTACG
jgi:hypothetical protein